MPILPITASLLLLTASVLPQTPSIGGAVTQTLSVQAFGNPNAQQTAPIGPLPAGGVNLAANTISSSASMLAAPIGGLPAGVAGFRLRTSGVGNLSFFAPGGFSTSGELVLTLSMPTPTPALVVILGAAQATGASASTQVDIDNDQTVEANLAVSTSNPNAAIRQEFGLRIGPTGRSIRLLHSGSGTALFNQVFASSDLAVIVYPGAYPITPYGPGCVSLSWTRDAAGMATFHCPAGSNSLAFFVVGFNAMQTPVPIAPGCYQLTNVFFSILALPVGGQASYALPLPPLPPGVAVRTQAVTIDPNLTVLTSNGLVMVGPP